jgi:hypothetical protein
LVDPLDTPRALNIVASADDLDLPHGALLTGEVQVRDGKEPRRAFDCVVADVVLD